jgi:hypothetical protein
MNNMKKGDVVSLVTLTGEFVGKFEDRSPTGVKIKDPRMLVSGKDGGMGFAYGVCQTGVKDTPMIEFFSGGIVFVTETNADIEKAYLSATSGIIL